MKFTDGYWLTKEQFNINSPREIFEYKKGEDALTIYSPFAKIKSRGDELNLGMMTIDFTSPIEGVIGVKLKHFDQGEKWPSFKINKENPEVNITNINDEIVYKSGDLSVKLPLKKDFNLSFYHNDKIITESETGAQASIDDKTTGKHYMREQLSLGIDELIYGLGERFTPFIKNGQSVDIYNKDGGAGSEQAYKNIPFYISSEGYGVFINQPENVSYEVASENVDRTQFSIEGESMEYFVIDGPTPKDILDRYTRLTGKISLPPAWSFGLWLSTSFTTNYNEETVMKFIEGMEDRNIPLDVFHFDCFWMKDFEWTSLLFNKEQFPNPEAMLKKIHEKGLKVSLWINPYIAQKSPLFKEAREAGYLLKRKDGNVWQWDLWQAGNGFIDFTNPSAVKWFTDKLGRLMEMGVDTFKTDFGERIPDKDVVFFDDSDPKREHNYYTYQFNQAVFRTIEDKKGKNKAIVFARSATAGSQKFPVHWGGDNLSTYKSMADSLRGGLSLLSSGFGFWSHDISGFEDEATPDLYKRWTQFGLLSSHSRYHGSEQYKVPWLFDEEAVENTRKFVNLKLSLMPYLYNETVKASENGTPLMRPLFFEFYEDHNTYFIERQYMFGTNLLIAPIFNTEGTVKYYLPEGKWTNLLTEETYSICGGEWISEKYDNLNLPILVRENSILLRKEGQNHAEYDYTDSLDIHLYQLENDIEIKTRVVNKEGAPVGYVNARKEYNKISVWTEGLKGTACIFIHENGEVKKEEMKNKSIDIVL